MTMSCSKKKRKTKGHINVLDGLYENQKNKKDVDGIGNQLTELYQHYPIDFSLVFPTAALEKKELQDPIIIGCK